MEISKQDKKFQVVLSKAELRDLIAGDTKLTSELQASIKTKDDGDTLIQATIQNVIAQMLVAQNATLPEGEPAKFLSMPMDSLVAMTIHLISPATAKEYGSMYSSIRSFIHENPASFELSRAAYNDGITIVTYLGVPPGNLGITHK